MIESVGELLDWLATLPSGLAYTIIGVGAALENLFPPVPSDTFLILAGVLADRGTLDLWVAGGIAWGTNVASALLVYALARRYGPSIFGTRWGHWLLRPHQLARVADFYGRYGLIAIFWSRFLPVLRVVVPVFAGISGLGFWATAGPLAIASAVWYALVLLGGLFASRNLERILEMFGTVNSTLLIVAGVLAALFVVWWIRSRRETASASASKDE